MSVFTDHLLNEAKIILHGIHQLEQPHPLEDLRVITYALRLLYIRSHAVKRTKLLIPSLARRLGELGCSDRFDEKAAEHYDFQGNLSLAHLMMSLDSAKTLEQEPLRRNILECASDISGLLKHEIDVILPLAAGVLTDEQQHDLLKQALLLDIGSDFERIQARSLLHAI